MKDLPAHIFRKFERRWASRLAREADARSQKLPHASYQEIVDPTGRHVPMNVRRSPSATIGDAGSAQRAKATG
jgi:hypothetical protein